MGFLSFKPKRRALPSDIPLLPPISSLRKPSLMPLPPLPTLEEENSYESEEEFPGISGGDKLPPLPRLEPDVDTFKPVDLKGPFETKIVPKMPVPPALPKLREFGEEISNGPLFPEIPEEPKAPDTLPDFPEITHKLMKTDEQKKEIPNEINKPIMKVKEEAHHKDVNRPFFVKVDDFKDILGEISSIKNEIKSLQKDFDDMNSLKNEKDKSLSGLNSTLRDLERKYLFIDKTLFETKYT